MHQDFRLYSGDPDARRDTPPRIPDPALGTHARETTYLPDPGLVTAVNVALALGQPLLVSGKPGCGKTQLAYHVARQFGMGEVQKVSVSSKTELSDLYYAFDHMAQFRDMQGGDPKPPERYLRFTGLGRAILMAGGPDAALRQIPGGVYQQDRVKAPERFRDLFADGEILDDDLTPLEGPKTTVVLVDEIDKAPRDTPNDMLGWLETTSFEIAELGLRVAPLGQNLPHGLKPQRPIVFFTTNSEKRLPDAFLRRCAYYDIPFPSADRIRQIVAARNVPAGALLDDTLWVLAELRAPRTGLTRPPGLAEYIAWTVLLIDRMGLPADAPIPADAMAASLPALVKLDADLDEAQKALAERLPAP